MNINDTYIHTISKRREQNVDDKEKPPYLDLFK